MSQKVWIANSSGHTYTAAEKFGELKIITNGHIDFTQLERVKIIVASTVIESDPEDYLLLSGATIVCVLCALLWIAHHGKIKLLNWDRHNEDGDGFYREMIITSDNLEKLNSFLRGNNEQSRS